MTRATAPGSALGLGLASLCGLAALTLAPSGARADRRAFTHTYEYMTMPRGDLELELYNTQTEDFDLDTSDFELQLEVEYGITERWDVSLYQVIRQGTDDPLHYAKTKVRTRYRFAERGEWPVDVLAYFEVAKPFGEAEVELEPKLILARDFGPVTTVLNLIGEVEIGDETELVPGFAFGATYEIAPPIKVGAEVYGELEEEVSATGDESHELVAMAGPAVSWAPSPKLWLASTVAFGVTEAAADLEVRAILSLGF